MSVANSFYEEQRFGSARWAEDRDVLPFLNQPEGVFLGYWKGRPLSLDGDAPLLTVAGAGAGKGRDVLMYNACAYPGSMLAYDPKGELAAVSAAAQARLRKHVWRFDPIHGGDRCDPLDILKAGSPTLHADAMLTSEMLCPLSGGANSQFFELRAREWLAAFKIADTETHGGTSLPRLYRIVNAIEGNPEGFLNFAKVMASNASEGVSRAAHEILTIQKEAPKEFGGIVSELYKYLAFLNDPMLLRSLEEPDFSLAALSDPAQRCNVYLNVPPEYIGIWNPFLRLCFGVAMLYKQR